ncbi:MAG: M20/M25/M40 family metallo-hydrolase [Bacteroidales bacterium]|nr:M20/M25/M40 family metallo-hydrolase [Bacteroidales bacterium]
MKRFLMVVAVSAMAASAILAQTRLSDETAYRIKAEGFSNSQVEPIAQFMTDDLGPRLAASQMKLRSEEMVLAKLKEMGFQNVRAEFAYDFPKGGWDNQMNYVAMTAPYYCSFAANPKAWSGSTNGMVKGECVVLDAKTKEDLEKYKGKLAGKIVLMPASQTYEMSFEPLASRYTQKQLDELEKDPRPRAMRRRMDGGSWLAARELQMAISEMLKNENVLAVVSGGGSFNVPSSRGVQYKVGNPEPTPEIILPIEDHGRMVRMIAKGTKVEMEMNIKNIFTDNQKINNVIAEIPGTDPKLKDEVILLGAHLDSWHGGTGGADNASGCIVMMEAMRIIKALGIQPKRTIRLALWGGEEQGLYGSRGYAETYLYDSKKGKALPGFGNFALYLNVDNGSGRFRGIYLEENDMAVPFFKTWMEPIESLGFTTLTLRKTGGTDHQSFTRYGLPAYQFIQDELEYDRTYHTVMDTYERLSLPDLQVDAVMVAWLALNAAMDNGRIPVLPGYPGKVKSQQQRR